MARKKLPIYEMLFLTKEQQAMVYKENYNGLLRFASNQLKDEQLAHDIVHDKFFTLFKDGYPPHNGDLMIYLQNRLFVAVGNACIDQFRKRKKENKELDDLSDDQPAEETDIKDARVDAQLLTALHGLMKDLSPESKAILFKRFREDKTRKIIAEEIKQEFNVVVKSVDREEKKVYKIFQKGFIEMRLWKKINPTSKRKKR